MGKQRAMQRRVSTVLQMATLASKHQSVKTKMVLYAMVATVPVVSQNVRPKQAAIVSLMFRSVQNMQPVIMRTGQEQISVNAPVVKRSVSKNRPIVGQTGRNVLWLPIVQRPSGNS